MQGGVDESKHQGDPAEAEDEGGEHAAVALRAEDRSRSRAELSRDELLDWLRIESDIGKSLCELLRGILIFMLVTCSLAAHLGATSGVPFDVNLAVLGEVSGHSKYLPVGGIRRREAVNDVPSFWYWLHRYVVPSCCQDNDLSWRQPGRIASFNQILGGVQLRQSAASAIACESSSDVLRAAYASIDGSQCRSDGDINRNASFLFHHQKASEIKTELQHLESTSWIGPYTTSVDVVFLVYNGHTRLFSQVHMLFEIAQTGLFGSSFTSETFLANSGIHWFHWFPYILLALLAFAALVEETRESYRLIRSGWKELSLCSFNTLPWTMIVALIAYIIVTIYFFVMVSGSLEDAIGAFPTASLNKKLWNQTQGTFLTGAQLYDLVPRSELNAKLEHLHDVADQVASLHVALRWCAASCILISSSMVLQGFRFNDRLNVVVRTIKCAVVDLIHLVCVAIVMLFGMAVFATAVFGDKIQEFSNIWLSFSACAMPWRLMMRSLATGEGMLDHSLPLEVIWLSFFYFLLWLVLLKMIYAIIMDSYSGVMSAGGYITIRAQVRGFIQTMRERRGHLPLLYLMRELEDDNMPAHPAERVTARSLRKAFERDKMTRDNAEYLVAKAKAHAAEREEIISPSIGQLCERVDELARHLQHGAQTTVQTIRAAAEEGTLALAPTPISLQDAPTPVTPMVLPGQSS